MEEKYDASKVQELHNQFHYKETEQQGSWKDCSIKVKEESYSIAAKYLFCVISNQERSQKQKHKDEERKRKEAEKRYWIATEEETTRREIYQIYEKKNWKERHTNSSWMQFLVMEDSRSRRSAVLSQFHAITYERFQWAKKLNWTWAQILESFVHWKTTRSLNSSSVWIVLTQFYRKLFLLL